MSKARVNFLLAVALLVFVSLACSRLGGSGNQTAVNLNSNSAISTSNSKTKTTPNTDGRAVFQPVVFGLRQGAV